MKTKLSRIWIAVLFFALAAATASAASGVKTDGSYQHYLKALLLQSQGSYEPALAELEKALEAAPESAFLHRSGAELYLRLGKMEEALKAIEKANDLDPKDAKALILAGQIYWAKGDTERAEVKFKQALAINPEGTEALVNLAGAVTPKDPRRAIKLYEDFLQRHPGEVEIQEQVAQLYQSLGEIEKAKKAWEKAIDWSPSSLKAHLALAQIAEVNYDTSTAVNHYEAVLVEDPSNLPLLLRVGELRYRNNEMAKAYEAFSRAQAISPGSASANFWLALLAENRGDWSEAIRLLKQVDSKTHDPGVALRLSYYYSQVGQFKEAIKILKAMSDADPANIDFLNYLSVAYQEEKQFTEAEKTLQKMLSLEPENPEIRFHLAILYDRTKKFPQAEEELKKAIALKPDYHVALNYLGYSYADRGIKLDDAERLVNDAIALDPDNGAYMDSMGWVYYKQGKLKKAEDFLREATFRTKDVTIWDHLGDVLASQGDNESAILAWDEGVRMDPKAPGLGAKIRKAVRRLSQKGKLDLFMKRAIVNFGDIKSINSFVQVNVCQNKPCFESRARLSYERQEELRVEIPGPLAGPLMLLTKPYGKPAQYGAIHPALQTVEFFVTRAFERINSLLSADVFREADLGKMHENIKRRGGVMETSAGDFVLKFLDDRGAVKELSWTSAQAEETLKLGSYGDEKSYAFPTRLEWIDKKNNFSIRMDLISPTAVFSSEGPEEADGDVP